MQKVLTNNSIEIIDVIRSSSWYIFKKVVRFCEFKFTTTTTVVAGVWVI